MTNLGVARNEEGALCLKGAPVRGGAHEEAAPLVAVGFYGCVVVVRVVLTLFDDGLLVVVQGFGEEGATKVALAVR